MEYPAARRHRSGGSCHRMAREVLSVTKPLFTGLCTALVTPFLDGKVNFPMLEVLIRRQLDAGVAAIVLAGTTGESPTLTTEEKLELFRQGVRIADGRCKIIAGTGSNSTAHAVRLGQEAAGIGVDGLLVVTPYYNKATQPGLVKHYAAICDAAKIPVIAYNVPSRTGMGVEVSTCRELAKLPNLAGLKEASGDISKAARMMEHLPIWSGNDDQTVATMALGGCGVISVASNVVPEQMNTMVHAALAGDYPLAAAIQRQLLPLMDALFCQVNPIPVKGAMEMIGLNCGDCRMPLDALTPENSEKIRSCLDELGISEYNR